MLNFYQKWKKDFIYSRTKKLSRDVRLLAFQLTNFFEIYVFLVAVILSIIFFYKLFNIVNNDTIIRSSGIAECSTKKANDVEEAMKYELLKLKKMIKPFSKENIHLYGDADIDINSQKALAELMPTLRFVFDVSSNYTSYDRDSDAAYCKFEKAVKMLNKIKSEALPDNIKKQLHSTRLAVSDYFEEQWNNFPPMNYVPKVDIEVFVVPRSGGKYRYRENSVGEALHIEAGCPRIFLLPDLNMYNVKKYIDEINENNIKWIHLPINMTQQTFNKLINGINGLDELRFSAYQYFPSFCFPPNFDEMRYEVYDISCLSSIPGLKILYIENCPGIKDLNVLKHMISLQDLVITGLTGLKNLHNLSSLTNLENLTLYNCPEISDLQPLSNLHKLKYLTIVHCPRISNLQPLAKLINLRCFNLKEINSSDIISNPKDARRFYDITPSQVDQLRKLLPDCEIGYTTVRKSGDWE